MFVSIDNILTMGLFAVLTVFYLHLLASAKPDPLSEGKIRRIA